MTTVSGPIACRRSMTYRESVSEILRLVFNQQEAYKSNKKQEMLDDKMQFNSLSCHQRNYSRMERKIKIVSDLLPLQRLSLC